MEEVRLNDARELDVVFYEQAGDFRIDAYRDKLLVAVRERCFEFTLELVWKHHDLGDLVGLEQLLELAVRNDLHFLAFNPPPLYRQNCHDRDPEIDEIDTVLPVHECTPGSSA